MNNITIAGKLLDHARQLEALGHNLYRIRAYRRAALAVKMLNAEVSDMLAQGGPDALRSIPGIGEHLAFTLESLVRDGELKTLGPKPEETNPRERLTSLPGVGPRLALRMREDLHIESVEQVETAAREGRLKEIGMGPRRVQGVLAVLEARQETGTSDEPSIDDLLAVDEEYRQFVADHGERTALGATDLTMHREGWTFTARFSQSPLAHRLGQTGDWVIIHFRNGQQRGERTIVTETRPPWRGQRVVRGREHECQACWAS